MTRFEKPIIVDEKDKPIPLAGQGFPYNDISSDRRFEELIYSIYKKKIENDTAWKTVYDDIALMQGVGEKGRDCVLYKNGAITGAIQCKKYKDRLTHPDCTKEILKFVLYSFFETTVLPDADNFTYYFAVSEGFSGPAADYLDKFNEEIVKEGELENWVNEVKTKYASLKNLDYKTILPELTKRLAAIKIRKILPQDLDMVLSASYCKAIIPLFFEVRTVTDNSKIDELISLVENRLPAPGEINVSEEDIVKQFETASLQLSSYRDDLHNIQNSHIQRQETTEVLGWVHRLLGKDEEPVLIVAGNPGYGKTVILKDVLVSLTDSKIPAIAIKADRYYAESVQELTEKLNLDHPLIKLVQKLRETQEMVVVIIDQIDSLSQSITSRRDYIDTYNQLIHQLRYIDGVRLIISIRTFDLNYDFEFSKFNQKQKIIVKELTEEQVRNVLMKLGLSSDNISSGLVKLLSVPNQLDIFCKIYRPGIVINQFHSLDDLYNELWRQKIGSQPLEKVQSLTSAVYEIADKIHNLQQLSLAESHLTDIARQSLPYLESNGLIVQTNQTLQFFHQSYYDYVFARSFSEKDNSLIDYIFEQGQSIFIRPAVKMILSFLRAKDHADYVKMASSILFSNKVRYHLQLLVINQLGFEENPSAIEVDFVGQKLLNSAKWQLPFLESAIGAKWFPILKDSGVLDRLLNPVFTFKERLAKNKSVKAITKGLGYANTFDSAAYEKRKENYLNLWYWIVRRSLVENRVLVIDYLDTLPSSEEKNYRVLRLLHSLKKWDYPLAFSVFESCTTDPEKHWFDILNILETTLEYDYDWTVKQIERYLTLEADRSEGGSSSMYDHQMGSCLKKMFEIDRGKAFNFAIEFIKKLIKKNVELIKIDTLDFYQDGAYDLYDFERDHSHNTKELMLQQALDSVEILAKEGSAVFEEFESANKEENSLTILKILLVGLESAPKNYCRRGLSLLLRLIQGKAYDKGLQYWMGQLINAIYPYLQPAEKDKLNLSLLNLRSEYDFYIHAEGSKRSFFSHYGKTRFELLSMIPEHEIMNDPKLKGHFQELQRKFGKAEKKKPRSVRLMRIGPPLEDSAYEKMGLEHWENSFLEFTTDERINWGSDRGGLTQNYREFEAKIPGNVDFFLPLIEKIIREKKVVPDYMLAGLNGLVKAAYNPLKFQQLYKELSKIPLYGFHVRQLVWLSDYLIRNNLVDDDLVSYLFNVVTSDPNPEKPVNPQNPEFDAPNSNRGSAIHALVKCFSHKEHGDKIFEALEKVANDPMVSVRISALNDLAVMMNIDKDRTLKLFLKFTLDTDDEHIFLASINCAQYLARYDFEALKPYFEKGINIEKVQGHLAAILAIAWLNDKPGSYEFLEKVWNLSDEAKANMVDIAIRNFLADDEKVKIKCEALYKKYLNSESKTVIHKYDTAFLHIYPVQFRHYLPLLKEFASSKMAAKEPHYFYEFLTKSSKANPVEVLEMLKNYKKYKEPNSATGPYYSPDDPVKALIGAYNGLYDHSPVNAKYVRKALDLFDEMLKNQLFREEAQKVLNVI